MDFSFGLTLHLGLKKKPALQASMNFTDLGMAVRIPDPNDATKFIQALMPIPSVLAQLDAANKIHLDNEEESKKKKGGGIA